MIKHKHHIAIILASILLSVIGVFIKFIGTDVPIMTVTFFRVLFGFIFIALILLFLDRKAFKVKKKDLMAYVVLGFLFAVNFSLFNSATLFGPISNAYLISQSYVIFTVIFAHTFLKEKITKKEIIALIIGLVGVVIMNPFESGYLFGNLLAIGNGVTFAMILVSMRFEERDHSPTNVMWFLLFSSLFLLPFPIIHGVGNLSANLIWIILLGILCTAVAYFLLGYGLKKVQAEMSSIMMLITIPVVSVLSAVVILKEALAANVIIGGVILVTAGVLLEFWK